MNSHKEHREEFEKNQQNIAEESLIDSNLLSYVFDP
jgi:hypothetical protein